MIIDHLRYFIALSENSSITKTGHAMSTTPQNVSRIIKKLETEMNTLLFLRTNSGISLTKEGEEFLEFCKNTVYQFDEMHSRFSFKDIQENQTVTLYSNDFLNEYFLNDALITFINDYPSISVNNIIVDYAEGFRKLEKDPLAIGFLFYDEQRIYNNSLTIIPTCELHPVVCVNNTHPLTKYHIISKEQLLKYRFIVCSKNSPIDSGTFHFLQIDPLFEQIPIISFGNLCTCYQMVANSDYIFFSIKENLLQQDETIQSTLTTIPLQGFTISKVAMIKSIDLPSKSPQQLLFSYILKEIQKLQSRIVQ